MAETKRQIDLLPVEDKVFHAAAEVGSDYPHLFRERLPENLQRQSNLFLTVTLGSAGHKAGILPEDLGEWLDRLHNGKPKVTRR